MRDINRDLRENVSEIELKCALTMLRLAVDKGEVPLVIKEHFKEFTGTQVHYITRILVIYGLIVSKKSGREIYIECVDNVNAKNILEDKPAPSSSCVVGDFHNLITVTQCEALEVLESTLKNKATIINIRELSRDNYFEASTVRRLLKYLKVSGIIEIKKYKDIGSKITVIDGVMFKIIVKRATKRINDLWKCS